MAKVDLKNGQTRKRIIRQQLLKALDALSFDDLEVDFEHTEVVLKVKRYPQGLTLDWQQRSNASTETGKDFARWDELEKKGK